MIKQLFLSSKKDFSHEHRKHHSFEEAREFGIIFKFEDLPVSSINKFAENLKQEGKSVSVISYAEEDHPKSFRRKDISYSGKIQNELLNEFISKNYDFLIVLSNEIDYNLEFVIKSIRADYKVSNSKNLQRLFQLSIQTTAEHLVSDLTKYLKMIRYE